MRIAIIYQSKSGNTRMLAERIYECIDVDEKVLCDIDESNDIPSADFYFIGFGIRNYNCGIDIANVMENIVGGRYALFITCGLEPTDKYKDKLFSNLNVWLPEESEYVDMFLCQGKIEKAVQYTILSKLPESLDRLLEMFDKGSKHPNENDLEEVEEFANRMIYEWC